MRLLRAEVWSPAGKKKLSRVAAAVVPDDVLDSPAVFAFGRLVVIGGDSHRLHEEVIVSGGVIREGRFSRLNVGEVRDALAGRTTHEPSPAVKQQLASLWNKIEAPLMQSLEARVKERTAGLEKLLSERSEKEVGDITAIMKELEKRISIELKNPENAQLVMEFNLVEREQFERNVHSLEERVPEGYSGGNRERDLQRFERDSVTHNRGFSRSRLHTWSRPSSQTNKSMSVTRHHAEWLSLLEVSGPFLSMPVLLKVFPQGLDAHDPEISRSLRFAYEEWDDNQTGKHPALATHRQFIRFVLTEVLKLPEETIREGQTIPQTLKTFIPEHSETLRPDLAIYDPGEDSKPRLLILGMILNSTDSSRGH